MSKDTTNRVVDSLEMATDSLAQSLLEKKEALLASVKEGAVKEGVVEQVNKISEGFELLILKLISSIPSVVGALLALVIGLFIIRTVIKIVKRSFERREVDVSLRGFLIQIIKFVLYALLILSVIGNLGFQTTAILGALSGLVLAAGLALQGSLSNFAGGVLILLFRPFEVGDYIENSAGTEGTVDKIDLLYTTLTNVQGIRVYSPNGPLANSVIRNFTKITNRRFEYIIGIAYEANVKVAKDTILEVLNNDERVLKDPAPEVYVNELAESSVNLVIRGWAEKKNFLSTKNSVQEEIKNALDKKGISIPFPQREMRILKEDV